MRSWPTPRATSSACCPRRERRSLAPTVRPAAEGDLDAIVALTAEHRRRLAGWAPTWWRPAAAADQLHPLWLRHLVSDPGTVVRVVEQHGGVVGGAVALPQVDRWVVDDAALAGDDLWPDDPRPLADSVTDEPEVVRTAGRGRVGH